MNIYKKIITGVILFIVCINNNAKCQNVPIVKFDYLKQILEKEHDSVYVINFWATWCKPCVEELPVFEKVTEKYKNKKIRVILVNLNFKKNYKKTLYPFLRERDINSEVVLLDETDYNEWINKVHPGWSGAIPATLIIYNLENFKKFFEKKIKFNEINSILKSIN